MRRLKSSLIAALGLVFLVPTVAAAQEAWLLLYVAGHYELAFADAAGIVSVAEPGDLKSYGISSSAIALLTHNTVSGGFELNLVDTKFHAITLSRSVQGFVPTMMEGASNNAVIVGNTVYFLTLRFTPGHPERANSLGGNLDLNAVNTESGAQTVIPLPKECLQAHLADYGGHLLVYDWSGYGVWQLDPSTNSLETLISSENVRDVLATENTQARSSGAMWPFSEQVVVPGAGVFRLTGRGQLNRMLDTELKPTPVPHAGVSLGFDLGEDRTYAHLAGATIDGQAYIGATGRKGTTSVYELLDTSTLAALWTVRLPGTVVYPTAIPIRKDAMAYVDNVTSAVVQLEGSQTKTLWSLKKAFPAVDALHVRILSLVDVPAL